MRYEAVGNNLHGALAGEDHREDDFNFFLKRNRVNNLPWSVDGSWWWCWECCWLTRNSLTAVVSLLGVGWKTARQRQVPQIAAKMNACERRDWGRVRLYWVGRYKDRRQDERLREDRWWMDNCYIGGWCRFESVPKDMMNIDLVPHLKELVLDDLDQPLPNRVLEAANPQRVRLSLHRRLGAHPPRLWWHFWSSSQPHHSSILILIIILIITTHHHPPHHHYQTNNFPTSRCLDRLQSSSS